MVWEIKVLRRSDWNWTFFLLTPKSKQNQIETVIKLSNCNRQFDIMEASKVKGLVLFHKTYRPFSFMLTPNSIALISGYYGSLNCRFFVSYYTVISALTWSQHCLSKHPSPYTAHLYSFSLLSVKVGTRRRKKIFTLIDKGVPTWIGIWNNSQFL